MKSLLTTLLVFLAVVLYAQPPEAIIHSSTPASKDAFGYSVSMSGNWAIVGVPSDDPKGTDSGSIFLYELISGVWTEKQNIFPSDGAASDQFGYSVSISGDWAVVGAPFTDGTNTNGKVYFYKNDGNGVWVLDNSFSNSAKRKMGTSVSIDNDYVIVGEPGGLNAQNLQTGSARVYRYDGNIWAEQATLFPSNGALYDEFGCSVNIQGLQTIIGAKGHSSSTGAAYIYSRIGTVWTQDATLDPFDGASNEFYGYAVAINGDRAVATAPYHQSSTGAAYFYRKSSGVWSLDNKKQAFDAGTGTNYGSSCDFVNSDLVIIGSQKQKIGSQRRGAAYLYEYDTPNNQWIDNTTYDKIQATDGKSYDYFGISVAGDGDYLVVGAYRDDVTSSSSRDGGSYFYDISATVLPVELTNFEASVINGKEVILDWSTASELNNDGFEIQRSQDGVFWENIGWVEGIGNSEVEFSYSHLDDAPYDGINYYRLNQVDFDGNTTLSPVVSVNIEELQPSKTFSFEVYPNPTKDYIYLDLETPEDIEAIIIYSLTGKVLKIERNDKSKINLVDLPQGNYILSIETKNGQFSRSILKK